MHVHIYEKDDEACFSCNESGFNRQHKKVVVSGVFDPEAPSLENESVRHRMTLLSRLMCLSGLSFLNGMSGTRQEN